MTQKQNDITRNPAATMSQSSNAGYPHLLAEIAKLNERVRELTEALNMLVDRNITYRGEELIIRFESHFHATNAAVKARAALSRAKEEA